MVKQSVAGHAAIVQSQRRHELDNTCSAPSRSRTFAGMTIRLSVTSVESPAGRSAEIAALHAGILACRSCETAGFISAAHPLRHPWTERQRTMIVGQAPGAQTEAKRFHFAGPGGILLGRWLAAAGYGPEHWRDQCYITSLTRCFPGKAPRGKGDRKPSPTELALCRPFLQEELRLVQPRIVLAVGTMAIEHFLGRGSLDSLVGTLTTVDGRLILPLPHPSGVSRWLNEPGHQQLVEQAIGLLAQAREQLDLW
jgi:uracil-DNA glycosylase family 4